MSDTFTLPKQMSASGEELPWRGYKLADVLPVLTRIGADDMDQWAWVRNSKCKYVRVAIDTRDGGYVRLFDRDEKAITLAEFERQLGKG